MAGILKEAVSASAAQKHQAAALSRTLIDNLSTRGRLMATTAIPGWAA